jgi:hypothetical protein
MGRRKIEIKPIKDDRNRCVLPTLRANSQRLGARALSRWHFR